MDPILLRFKSDAVASLGDNLVCLLHHGSRAKGEAYAESDYDVMIIVKRVNERVLRTLRDLFERNPRLSCYLLSLDDIETLPLANLLQSTYAKPLYGEISAALPSSEEVRQYISHSRRDWLDTLRHNLLFPHPSERKARLAYYMLKNVYLYLSYLAYCETKRLPKTRKQTIAHFQRRKEFSDGVELLQILDKWNSHKVKVDKNPDRYLFMLEKFLRNAYP